MKRLLLLITGDEGRDVAAQRVRVALLRQAPRQVRVDLVNPLDHAGGGLGERLRHPFLAGALAAQSAMGSALRSLRPDLVLATHPSHAALIAELERAGRPRDFRLIALVAEPDETGWAATPCDSFIVPGEAAARGLMGVEPERLRLLGYPVVGPVPGGDRNEAGALRLLWIVNSGRSKAPRLLTRLLALPGATLTLVSDESDMADLVRDRPERDRLHLVRDAGQIHALLVRHHLVISRPETVLWHEAVAAGCPLIAYRGDGPAERRNARLLREANAGAVAEKPREAAEWASRAWDHHARLLNHWRRNAEPLGRPHGADAIARFLLDEAAAPPVPRPATLIPASVAVEEAAALPHSPPPSRPTRRKLLLCDLHTHTTWSDGKLTIAELVDFYGQRGFDCLAVTDHLCDPKRLLGRLVNLTGLVIAPDQVDEYFAAIEREKQRAWSQYKLLLLAGIEFNKDGYTPKTSAHLLGVDLHRPIDPSLDIPGLIGEIHAQGGLAIASHPHEVQSEWGKNTLYLWENIEQYAPLLDAWEIANRDDLFNPVGLRKLPFIAGSDFHKPRHIHSWKTLLWCEKDPEAIKHCIRQNRDVSLTLYRDRRFGLEERAETTAALLMPAAS